MTLFAYILRQVAFGVVLAVVGMFFIAIPGVTVSAVHRLGGVGLATLLAYLPLVLLELVPYLLPIGFLLAVVSTYGRLAADNEWTAMRMAGVHPLRIMAPAGLVALACAGVLYIIANQLAPGLALRQRELLRESVVESFRNLNPGQTELHIGQFYLNAAAREGNTFKDALIHIPSGGEKDRTVLADTVTIVPLDREIVIQMTNCRTVYGTEDTTIGRPTVRLNLDQLFRTDRKTRSAWRYQPTPELRAMLARGEIEARDLHPARYEVQRRLALAFTPLLFLLLGVPTGLLLRSSTQLGALAIAVLYALIYYLFSMRLAKTLGVEGALSDWVAAWIVSIVGSIGGLTLSWRAFRQ